MSSSDITTAVQRTGGLVAERFGQAAEVIPSEHVQPAAGLASRSSILLGSLAFSSSPGNSCRRHSEFHPTSFRR
jgi:hypothetical protein